MPAPEPPADMKLACIFRVQRDGSIKSTTWFVEPQEVFFRVLHYVTDNLQVLSDPHSNDLRLDQHHIQVLREHNGDTWTVLVSLVEAGPPPERATGNVFQSVFKYSAIAMALLEVQQGRFQQVNDALLGLLGYSREELLSMTLQNVTHPEDLQADQHDLRLLLDRKIDAYQLLKRLFTKAGETLWVLLSVSMILRKDGTPQFLLVQLQNETENLSYRDHLEKQLATVEQAQRRMGVGTVQVQPDTQTVVFSGSMREFVPHWKGSIRFPVLQQDLGVEQHQQFLKWVQDCQQHSPSEVVLRLPSGRTVLFRGWAEQGEVLGVAMARTEQTGRTL